MAYRVTSFETTPNPNAVKCWLDRPISDRPRSFLDADAAAEDPIAASLFEDAGAVCVLLNGDWVTVNKPGDVTWPVMKKRIERVLAEASE